MSWRSRRNCPASPEPCPQVLDQAIERSHLTQRRLDISGRLVDPVRQRLQRALQNGQRIVQLVRDIGGLGTPGPFGLLKVTRHLVESHTQTRDLSLLTSARMSNCPRDRVSAVCVSAHGCHNATCHQTCHQQREESHPPPNNSAHRKRARKASAGSSKDIDIGDATPGTRNPIVCLPQQPQGSGRPQRRDAPSSPEVAATMRRARQRRGN